MTKRPKRVLSSFPFEDKCKNTTGKLLLIVMKTTTENFCNSVKFDFSYFESQTSFELGNSLLYISLLVRLLLMCDY
jgi:hypothetical protein